MLSTRYGESDSEENRNNTEEYAHRAEHDNFATAEDRLFPQQPHG
jgi:hypothetical protein